jgi:hypothetical protein
MLSKAEIKWLYKLAKRGFVVVVFTPQELEGADPKTVEKRLIEAGWEIISAVKPAEPITNP